MPIPTNVKNFRELRSFTQAYVASQLGISQESYSKLECGKVKIDEERLEQIAHILDVKVETLKSFDVKFIFNHTSYLAGQEVGTEMPSKEKELYERIIKAKDDEIEILKRQLAIYQS